MKELGDLMNRAVELAGTELEKRRVDTWKEGVWDYMVDGRREYVNKKRGSETKVSAPGNFNKGAYGNHMMSADRAVGLHWHLTQSVYDCWKSPIAYAIGSGTLLATAEATPSEPSR